MGVDFRKNSQYCYKHLTTGEIQWEYPDTAATDSAGGNAKTDDDEMDICTTPPPNVDEQLNIGHGSTRKSKDNGEHEKNITAANFFVMKFL